MAGTSFKGPLYIKKSDGTKVAIADADGNIDAPVTTSDLTTTGNTILGNAVTDTTGINGATTITSTSASALAVGLAGATNPALQVDASTASSATGVKVKSAAAAGGVAISVVSSGTDENLTVDAKGSGTVTLGGTSTGNIVAGRALTGVSASMTGAVTAKSATAVPATAGAVAAGAPLSMNTEGITIEVTSDAPTHARAKGSICINTAGSSTSTRLYVNTDGSTGWAAVTTAS
jgi:hypothetical protein